MAELVLGLATSHTPLLSLAPELWPAYAQGDQRNPELAYPPHGHVLPYQQGEQFVSEDIKARFKGDAPYADQAQRCQRALDILADTLQSARPDITIIVSDDQDEWLYEDNMPMFSLYWGESVPLVPMEFGGPMRGTPVAEAIQRGYGDVPLDVPVAHRFGRHALQYLVDHDFDMAHMTYARDSYGGKVARRYPTPDGELSYVRETAQKRQGLPHGFAFVVKRLYGNQPRAILPIMQNTCYPPNTPSARRSFALGQAIAGAVEAWSEPARVAIVASGGLSHFVVDEETDRNLLGSLERKDADGLKSVPRERLYSAASESLNWVAVGGAVQDAPLQMELLDYVPVYRTPAGTGGGWAFARWQ